MPIVYKVSQFPAGDIPDGVIYYNRSTREVLLNTSLGKRSKFGATYIPKEIDVISIGGYHPLYTSEILAKQNSPLGRAVAYGANELGPAPLGVTYPVWMPEGYTPSYFGDYIDPAGDDDGDGILNFRDPDVLGLSALPSVNYTPPSPYITSNGVSVDILNYLTNPDGGTLNNTNNDVITYVHSSGIIIGPNGEIIYFIGPGAASIPPGWVLFMDIGKTSSPLPGPTPAYTGDPFITSSGASVNIKDLIGNPDSGSYNNTGSPITINTINSGIIVCDDGSVSYFGPGQVTIPSGCTMFRDLDSTSSPLTSISPAYTSDPFITSLGASVNILDYLSDPDFGTINDTGSTITIQLSEPSILVAPDGTVIVLTPIPGSHSIPPGYVLFTNKSKFVSTFTYGSLTGSTPSVPSTGVSVVQWFEEDSNGNLVLRTVSFEETQGIQYWEPSGNDSYMPRDGAYTGTESVQYFEEDGNGNIIPTISPN